MRIVSAWRDYYDSIQAMGQDVGLQYIRKEQEFEATSYPFPTLPQNFFSSDQVRGGHRLNVDSGGVAFCGRVYGYIKLDIPDPNQAPYSYKRITMYCYNMDAIDSFLGKHFKPKELVEYHRPVDYKTAGRKGRKWPSNYSRAEFARFFEAFDRIDASRSHWQDTFQKHHTPAFTYYQGQGWKDKPKLVINPRLSDIEFFRVFDPYQAFQEISMFLGGMASPEKPIPHVGDEDMAACKGFDKWSFRKPPGKKKRKRSKK